MLTHSYCLFWQEYIKHLSCRLPRQWKSSLQDKQNRVEQPRFEKQHCLMIVLRPHFSCWLCWIAPLLMLPWEPHKQTFSLWFKRAWCGDWIFDCKRKHCRQSRAVLTGLHYLICLQVSWTLVTWNGITWSMSMEHGHYTSTLTGTILWK